MSLTRGGAFLLVLGALLVTGSVAASRSASGLAQPSATSAGCKNVGWIAAFTPHAPQASLRLAGAAKSCSCPVKACTKVSRDQYLFVDERMDSGGGKITFKSVVKGVPNLTCIMPNKTSGVIYPSDIHLGQADHAVLELLAGGISCQVEQGTVAQGRLERGLHRQQHRSSRSRASRTRCSA